MEKATQTQVGSLKRWPAQPTRLVFRPKAKFKKLKLKLEELLKWEHLELVLPDHERYGEYVPGEPYDDKAPSTYIEVPWGVVFAPKYPDPSDLIWTQQVSELGRRVEADLEHAIQKSQSVSRARRRDWIRYIRSSVDNKTIKLENDGTLQDMVEAEKGVPLTNVNRLELIANLSGRFRYTES